MISASDNSSVPAATTRSDGYFTSAGRNNAPTFSTLPNATSTSATANRVISQASAANIARRRGSAGGAGAKKEAGGAAAANTYLKDLQARQATQSKDALRGARTNL